MVRSAEGDEVVGENKDGAAGDKAVSIKKVIAQNQMRENKNLLEMMLLSQKLSKKKQQNSVLLI
jgi:hypothetical protein